MRVSVRGMFTGLIGSIEGGPVGARRSGEIRSIVDTLGSLYIADYGYGFIRKVSMGVITTLVGGGFDGDNGPASSAFLSYPSGVAVDAAGNL